MIAAVRALWQGTEASLAAALVQVVLASPHRCTGLVCPQDRAEGPLLVTTAVNAKSMIYPIRRGATIPASHFIARVHREAAAAVVSGHDTIPFSMARDWRVDVEAFRVGSQVVAMLHPDGVARPNPGQLVLL